MEQKTLSVQDRKETGKGAAHRLRAAGRIPAVVYGKSDPVSISIDASEFAREFKHVSENILIQLGTGKNMKTVIIKDYQANHLKNTIEHIDFYEIEKGKTLTTHVPFSFTGNAAGVKEGGILEEYINEVEVECMPKDIPESIVIDVTALNVGDSIHLAQVPAPKGVTIHGSEDQVVVAVHAPASTVEPSAEEEEEAVVAAGADAGSEEA